MNGATTQITATSEGVVDRFNYFNTSILLQQFIKLLAGDKSLAIVRDK